MYKDKKPQSRKSFTLAEMLITLTIVSVVAIVTLPSLFYQIDDFKWNSSRQKMVYNIKEAARRMSFQNAGGTGGLGTAANFRDELKKYLSAAKSCDTVTDCFSATIKDMAGNKVTTPTSGADISLAFGTDVPEEAVGMILNNGASLNIIYNSECMENGPVFTYGAGHVCANIIFDINGFAPPNQVGKDIGFASIIDPKTSTVVGIIPDTKNYSEGATTTWDWWTAQEKCKAKGVDWYLPNKDELNSLYFNHKIIGTLNIALWYWSSTEYAPNTLHAWDHRTVDGSQDETSKGVLIQARCVKR